MIHPKRLDHTGHFLWQNPSGLRHLSMTFHDVSQVSSANSCKLQLFDICWYDQYQILSNMIKLSISFLFSIFLLVDIIDSIQIYHRYHMPIIFAYVGVPRQHLAGLDLKGPRLWTWHRWVSGSTRCWSNHWRILEIFNIFTKCWYRMLIYVDTECLEKAFQQLSSSLPLTSTDRLEVRSLSAQLFLREPTIGWAASRLPTTGFLSRQRSIAKSSNKTI